MVVFAVECVRCNGEDYQGPMDHTETGKECQRWDAMKPHRHPYLPKKYAQEPGLNRNRKGLFVYRKLLV